MKKETLLKLRSIKAPYTCVYDKMRTLKNISRLEIDIICRLLASKDNILFRTSTLVNMLHITNLYVRQLKHSLIKLNILQKDKKYFKLTDEFAENLIDFLNDKDQTVIKNYEYLTHTEVKSVTGYNKSVIGYNKSSTEKVIADNKSSTDFVTGYNKRLTIGVKTKQSKKSKNTYTEFNNAFGKYAN